MININLSKNIFKNIFKYFAKSVFKIENISYNYNIN